MTTPGWLQQMIAPTLMLWLYAAAYGVAMGVGSGWSKQGELAASIALPLVISSWVVADARKRDRRLCYDFDSFVYFAWPLVVPVYLVQTRGVRALLTLLCFAGIWIVAGMGGLILRSLRDVFWR